MRAAPVLSGKIQTSPLALRGGSPPRTSAAARRDLEIRSNSRARSAADDRDDDDESSSSAGSLYAFARARALATEGLLISRLVKGVRGREGNLIISLSLLAKAVCARSLLWLYYSRYRASRDNETFLESRPIRRVRRAPRESRRDGYTATR